MIREKRKYIRVEARLDFAYKIKGSDSPKKDAVTKNISPGGIQALLDKITGEGKWLELELRLPTSKEAISAIGKVVWTVEGKNGKIDAGIKFEEIDPLMKNRFLEYLCELMFSELENSRGMYGFV